jgi:signal transduction histidine kinase
VRLNRILRTTTFRLALVYMALFGGSALVLLGFLYWATAGYMARQTDETIGAEIAGLAEQYRQGGLDGLSAAIAGRMSRNPRGNSIYLLADPKYQRIVGNLDRWPPSALDSRSDVTQEGWIDFTIYEEDSPRGDSYRAHARHFLLPGGFHLLVGRDVQERERLQALIIEALAWGLAITAALAFAGGALMSRSTIARIDAVNRTSREIMKGDLTRRVPTAGTGDEFDQLAENLNSMLDRIETLMSGIRQVSDNIAHDLRSPLTRMRSRLEVARMGELDPTRARALIEETIAEADTLLSTFNALLRIAEIEAGRSRAGFGDVDLSEVVRDAVELYEPLAQERRQALTMEVDAGLSITGDRHLLSQAVANLIDNAIKYTPDDREIAVTLIATPRGAALRVADGGPGIPAEFRDKVLQRFFRLEASRSTPGSGLGLSLVAAVAHLHDAQLDLGDNNPGLIVTITFPLQARKHA